MNTEISLTYAGPAVDAGRMNVYEVASNMTAFSEFMVIAAKVCYGPDVKVDAQVTGFSKGSFVTDFAFVVAGTGTLSQVIAAFSEAHLWEIAKGAIALFKHLGGKKPTRITNSGNYVQVENNSGSIIQVRMESVNVTLNRSAGEAAQHFIGKALANPDMERVTLARRDDVELVDARDAASFRPIDVEESVSENTIRQTLILESAAFRESLSWRFSDGERSFTAQMVDDEFLARLDEGERFGKGDRLDVQMRVEQISEGGKITITRTIVKVVDHKGPVRQGDMLSPRRED